MCIKIHEVKKLLEENNKLRDEKWEQRFFEIQKDNTEQHARLQENFLTSIQKHIEHLKTSPDTQKELNNIHITCAERGRDLSNMTEDIKEIKKDLREIKDFNSKLLDGLDNRYASKEVETALKRINWILIVTVIAAVLALVIKD